MKTEQIILRFLALCAIAAILVAFVSCAPQQYSGYSPATIARAKPNQSCKMKSRADGVTVVKCEDEVLILLDESKQ